MAPSTPPSGLIPLTLGPSASSRCLVYDTIICYSCTTAAHLPLPLLDWKVYRGGIFISCHVK